MGKYRNMAKSGNVFTRRGCPVLKPQGPACSKRDVHNFDALPKSHKHEQGIIHGGKARGHTAVCDTGAQQSMIGQYVWEIIKRHDNWIYAHGVNMGGPPNAGRYLKLVDATGVAGKPSRWEVLTGNC